MGDEGWIQLDVVGGGTATVRDLVAELDADWEVRESHGVGIDPVTLVAIIAVPFSAFFVKFLEVAAVDSYKALKNWLRRLSAATHANLELRDPDIPQVIRLPRNPTEAEFRQFLPPLAAAMVRRGYELERRKDHVSVEEARLWYQRAFDADGADEGTRLEAACHLVVLLRRHGDADSLKDAEVCPTRSFESRGGTSDGSAAV
jgi:hypothetical protein